ncbi:MAG TPA: hypothetical protein PLG94_17920 [Smithellaceae bacterium]|nr:hypothetical protein [Smithellaceae bacterium]
MMSVSVALSIALREFIESSQWTFAKTMPEWPHEYLVRDRVDRVLFEALVCHIRQHGIEQRFYQRVLTYFAEDGLLYWTMGEPIEETTIINRCKEEGSYENRMKNGTLPNNNGNVIR